ncbi:hypothetical protein EC2730350_2721 [Escherichia coli 2730350]|nr:hypothetical protein EC2730350_2721 [Escherichia coli 2730350]KDA62675.1 hypothetical protein AA99_3090 [Escherichia coli 2-052-05_S1_C1]
MVSKEESNLAMLYLILVEQHLLNKEIDQVVKNIGLSMPLNGAF